MKLSAALAGLVLGGSSLLSSGAAVAQEPLILFEDAGLTVGDDPVECVVDDSDELAPGVRICESDEPTERLLSHDGLAEGDRIPLDFRLRLPPTTGAQPDGGYPLVVLLHGWGNNKDALGGGLEALIPQLNAAGIATLTYNARGWGGSCGPTGQTDPACSGQYNHLADLRYEIRDTQYLAGLLADELSNDGIALVDGQRIGVTGISYGGGQSSMLGVLRDKVVNLDGSLTDWVSPDGKPMRIAAAAPYWPWTDLAYALGPNGRGLDYVVDSPYFGPNGDAPVGVVKASYVSLLFGVGKALSVYAPPGSEPALDEWYATFMAGEPYGAEARDILTELTDRRSAYYLLDRVEHEPAPFLFNAGWSDDIFPTDEVIRFVNRLEDVHPDADVAVHLSNFGHPRSQDTDREPALRSGLEFFAHHLTGDHAFAMERWTLRPQDCSGPAEPITADSWIGASPGEVRQLADGPLTITYGGPTSPEAAYQHDPTAPNLGIGGGACAAAQSPPGPGAVVLQLDQVVPGATLLGSPTVIADIAVTGSAAEDTQVAARLIDVDADGNRLLLARTLYRPGPGRQVFQLHPIGWTLEEGHRLELELLASDNPYSRPANFPFQVTLESLDIRLPVAQRPGQVDNVSAPATPFVPDGYEVVPDATARGADPAPSDPQTETHSGIGGDTTSDGGLPTTGGGAVLLGGLSVLGALAGRRRIRA